VISAESKQTIETLCRDVDKAAVQDFFARMDEDYFSTFSPGEICAHIRMSCALDSRHRIQFRVTPRESATGGFDIVIVGFDYLSEFSIFCGLLSAFGLNICAGDIYSFGRKASRPSPRKIVDVFSVSLKAGETFDEAKQRDLENELQTFAHLLAANEADQARERLNRFLTERIEKMNEALSGLLSPIEIRFDNRVSEDWTVMETHSEDAFAFLYAISNALAMQGVYIHKVRIRGAGREVRNEFYIADRWGRKIEDAHEQKRLRMAVAMIKQFTRFLPEAPDPGKAMHHFDQFLDKIAEQEFPDHIVSFLADTEGMNLLAHLLGSSDFLWNDFLRIHFAELLPILEDLSKSNLQPLELPSELRETAAREAATFEAKKRALNRFKDRRLFMIDAAHLLEPQITLMAFSRALTELAEAVIVQAAKICYQRLAEQRGRPPGVFTVCGLGKFGGREMGYASDLELLFVHDGEETTPFFEMLAREVTEFIEARNMGIFRIDLRLRPFGEKGALSTRFEEFQKYYSANGQAAPFERQALIKLRWVAGDEPLGRRVETHRDAFSYSGAAWDWENALHLRRRQMRELVKPGQTNVKYSAGGIIDIEYAVQYLQLLHGKGHPGLRVSNTLEALDQLRNSDIIGAAEYETLRAAYLFLRNLIDALRIVRGDASDLVLPDETSEEFKSLARRLGYREQDRAKDAALLAADIAHWKQKVHDRFLSRFK